MSSLRTGIENGRRISWMMKKAIKAFCVHVGRSWLSDS
jgi:hypothetical protein